MNCVVCSDLRRVFAAESNAYREAHFSACYRVTTDLAGQKNVVRERARYVLEEHSRVCAAMVKPIAPSPVSDVPTHLERLAA